MLKSIVTWALEMRVLVLALATVLVLAGVAAIRKAPLDVFPEFAPPMAEIQTEAPGLSTEQGPAITAKWPPPMRTPPTETTVWSGRASRLTSL